VKAVEWTRKAADQGHAISEFGLGVCYAGGMGVQRDLYEAARWFHKAAKQGDMEAQWEIAEAFHRGLGVQVNMSVARKYLRKAATQGHAEAAALLKTMRQCALCGADAAPRACKYCGEARYCARECLLVRTMTCIQARCLLIHAEASLSLSDVHSMTHC
jgi:TPR repeat protein